MNSGEKQRLVKCFKCRHVLISALETSPPSHVCVSNACNSYNIKNFVYLLEDILPEWIKSKVEEEQWTKGKLHCAHCGCRVGSFDFVSGRKCECGNSVLPPVHFVTSQIDIPIASVINGSQ